MIPAITKNITVTPVVKSSTNNVMALAVVLIVASCLFFWFFILPKKTELKIQQDQRNSVSNQEQGFADQVKKLKALVVELKNHQQENDKLDRALPLNAKTFDLEALIRNLANSVNVTIGDISITAKSGFVIAGDTSLLKNPYQIVRVLQKTPGSVSVSGTFSQLEEFLKKVESSSRILEISDLEISSGQNGQLQLKLGLNAYYLAAK